jgi:hypothetical protein
MRRNSLDFRANVAIEDGVRHRLSAKLELAPALVDARSAHTARYICSLFELVRTIQGGLLCADSQVTLNMIPSEKTAPISGGKTAPVDVSGDAFGRRRAHRTVSTHGHFLR